MVRPRGVRAPARATCCRPVRARASPTVRRRALADLRKDMDTSGAGFNQFDPVLSATGAISRRFGIGGGLALLALLAATEGSEIVKTLTAGTATAGDGAKITTASGLVYSDVLVGAKNGQPGPATGAIIGADIRLSIGDKARTPRAHAARARARSPRATFRSVTARLVPLAASLAIDRSCTTRRATRRSRSSSGSGHSRT